MTESPRTGLLATATAALAACKLPLARNRAIGLVVIATLVTALLIQAMMGSYAPKRARSAARHFSTAALPAAAPSGELLPTVEPQTFEQVSPEEAEARNAARPLAKRPLEPARAFVFPSAIGAPLEWNRAVNCLALANYYEAASEGPAGMRAVSQVVLNRVRHPAFPKSVCEVVFQGADRSTGCQFTFTCDGSLARPAIPALMARARAVAIAALHGTVERGVGMATHYHTRQVVPYWADSLDKIRVVGAHIFYVWRGGAGSRAAFQGQYAGEGSAIADAYLPADQRGDQEMGQVELAAQDFQQSARQLDQAAAGGSRAKRAYLVADEGTKPLLADDASGGKLQAQQLIHLSAERIAPDPR